MPPNPKVFFPKTAVFVTSRVEEGLPFVCSLHLRAILWGILARASSMYQVKVCHFLWMANHLHLLIVVDNPEHVKDFVGYIKTESAHAVNRLMGRRRRTVWCEGYDSPTLLTTKEVLRYILYTYSNPARADLEETIEKYPGLNSWSMYMDNKSTKRCPWIRRPAVPQIGHMKLTAYEQKELKKELIKHSTISHEFVLEPDAWMVCFAESRVWDPQEVRAELARELRKAELQCKKERKGNVIGTKALMCQSMDKPYTPSKHANKTLCLCSDLSLRKSFILLCRVLFAMAREVYENWKRGDFSVPFPPGLFAPSLPRQANMVGPPILV